MSTLLTTDFPIQHPDADLLGVALDARRLAEFLADVSLPFTLGVYGEWGEGKTSFVGLLAHFLAKQKPWERLQFLEFSAWPYTTGDAVWRALVLHIAKEIYGITDSAGMMEDTPEQGLLPKLAHFLRSDAIVFRQASTSANKREQYERLLAKLDRAPPALADRSPASTLDQSNAVLALSTTFLEAASAFSPWLGGIRKLFGLDKSVDWQEMLRTRVGVEKRELAQSVVEIRSELRRMFSHGSDKRFVVLIDDLDRCMPAVALDVLEMIKIFFFESGEGQSESSDRAQCLFVVAADQSLIGQGLRARLREAEKGETTDEGRNVLQRKGQEYFEKIIQFGIKIPEQSSDQTHRFVATHFPAWACATDILRAAIGTNPRRLKQQCNLLTYKEIIAKDRERL